MTEYFPPFTRKEEKEEYCAEASLYIIIKRSRILQFQFSLHISSCLKECTIVIYDILLCLPHPVY